MGISHSISKLTRQKAERLGEIAKHRDAIKRLQQEIKKLDDVVRMIDAGVDVDAVKPVRTRPGPTSTNVSYPASIMVCIEVSHWTGLAA